MSRRGDEMAARARGLIGTRFRPQGRDPEYGLDCVGTAAAAAGLPPDSVRSDYGLRGQRLADVEHDLCDQGWRPVPGNRVSPGDILVFQLAPGQFHVGVATRTGLVHADAGLRRVVERPWPVPWPLAGLWRMSAGEEDGWED